jgi:hypothetical protein
MRTLYFQLFSNSNYSKIRLFNQKSNRRWNMVYGSKNHFLHGFSNLISLLQMSDWLPRKGRKTFLRLWDHKRILNLRPLLTERLEVPKESSYLNFQLSVPLALPLHSSSLVPLWPYSQHQERKEEWLFLGLDKERIQGWMHKENFKRAKAVFYWCISDYKAIAHSRGNW